MKQFKDILGNFWGFTLAFILPGMAALYGVSLWSFHVEQAVSKFIESPTVIFFLLLVLGATVLGIQMSILSWVFYEIILFRVLLMKSVDMVELEFSDKFADNRSLIREPYRYYQFLGGMSFVMPLFFVAFFKSGIMIVDRELMSSFWALLAMMVMELATICAAVSFYRSFIYRASHLLKKENAFFSKVDQKPNKEYFFSA